MTQKSTAPCKTDAPPAPGTLGPVRKCVVGIQFLFVAFGGTVLMPLLVGLEPSTALFTAGVGTLLFHAVTKGKVPVFLGSSFAFIAPILAVSGEWGLDAAAGGFLGVAAASLAASALVRWRGTEFLDRVFPPVVVGPTIVLIGLSLAGGAVTMAQADWLLAFVSLAVAVAVMSWGRGLPRLLPVVAGVGAGYAVAAALGRVDVSGIADPVVGGIMLLLFGSIASVGIQGMVRNKVDFSETRNLVISGVMLTLGVGGAAVRWGSFSLGGIGLSALVGIALNAVLPRTRPSADPNAVDGGRHPRWKAPPEH